MADDEYKKIFSNNLKYYMNLHNKNQMDLMNDLHLSSSTVSNWCTGLKLPRMDKVQMLADYFGVLKSDLIEEKSHSPKSPKIMVYYNQLNDIGKHEATKRVEELTNLPQYINEPDRFMVNAAHAISGASEEDKQYDEDIMDDENF